MNIPESICLAILFKVKAELASPVELGAGPRGRRRIVPILSGSFEGPRINGILCPDGIDWQITRPDGVTEIEAHYSLETDDGA